MLSQAVALSATQVIVVGGALLPREANPAQLVGAVPSKEVLLVNVSAGSGPKAEVSSSTLGELPLPLAGHVAALLGTSSVWVVGGFSAENIAPLAVLRIELARNADGRVTNLTKVDLFRSNRTSIFAAHAVLQDRQSNTCGEQVLVTWGGLSSATGSLKLVATNAMHFLRPSSSSTGIELGPLLGEVEQLGTVPSARVGAACCAGANGDIFLCGGRRGEAVCDDFYVGCVAWGPGTASVTWRTLITRTESVQRFGGFLAREPLDRYLIVGGGWSLDGDGKSALVSRIGVVSVPQDASDLVLHRYDALLTADPVHTVSVALPTGLLVLDRQRPAELHAWPPQEALEVIPHRETEPLSDTQVANAQVDQPVPMTPQKSPTPPPPAVLPEELVCHLVAAPKNVGHTFALPRKGLDVDAFRAYVLAASGVPSEDVENGLIFMTTRDGRERPIHLPDTLTKLLRTAVDPIPLTVVVEKPPRNYSTTLPAIGKGTFGTVYRAINTADNRSFCLKRVKIESSRPSCTITDLIREIRMMRHLRHENLVRYLGSKTEAGSMYIFMEFVTGDTLEKTCRSIPMTIRQIQLCVRQVLAALDYLHSFNVVHRDIKGANVLFDAEGRVKVSDFGTAKHLNPSNMTSSNRPAGTILYMAPEVMKAEATTTAADIWSLGCLVIEMASGNYPYVEKGYTDPIQVVNALCNHKLLPKIPDRLSDDGKDFVKQCLRFEPSERPSCAQLFEHPFVKLLAPDEPLHSASHTSSPGSTAAFGTNHTTLQADSVMPELKETKGNKPSKLLRRPKAP